MTELVCNDPCVLFALARERGPFHRDFPIQQRFPGAPCWARFCGPAWLSVLVLETGIGPTRMRQAVDWLLNKPLLDNLPYHPRVVISAGFSGALQPNLAIGDLVLGTEVVDSQGRCWPLSWPGDLPSGPWQPPMRRGRLMTMPRLVADPEEKRALGQQHQALAVDMETAEVAEICQRRGVPFGCLRVISDTLETRLSPQLVSLLAAGRASPWRILAALARAPRLLPELWRLGQHTHLASKQLASALGELLTLKLPWGRDLV